MKAYFIRRLLLVPITMFGVTLLVFLISRVVPGGPMERALMEQQRAAEEGGGSRSSDQLMGLSEEGIEAMEEEYGYDKPAIVAYFQWLGLAPRDHLTSKKDFSAGGEETVGASVIEDPKTETLVVLKGSGLLVKVVGEESTKTVKRKEWVLDDEGEKGREVKEREVSVWKVKSATFTSGDLAGKPVSDKRWQVKIESPDDRRWRWANRNKEPFDAAPENYDARAVVSKKRLAGLLQGNLGESNIFGDSVASLIKQRIPVALYFGILTAIITYGVCLPLGILKAIKHRTMIDNMTSILIFVGYSIPGFALGAVLLTFFGARLGWFPMFDWRSPDFDTMSTWGKVKDQVSHTILPLTCYVVSGFAWLTMMMKNNLMDNLAADYVRTAVAKGVRFRTAVFKHAFRNSFIPIASTLGQLITILVAGSILIETVFDIQGFGLLQFQALLGRDMFTVMGTLTIASFLLVVGNILSDFIVAMIDPRVKFH